LITLLARLDIPVCAVEKDHKSPGDVRAVADGLEQL